MEGRRIQANGDCNLSLSLTPSPPSRPPLPLPLPAQPFPATWNPEQRSSEWQPASHTSPSMPPYLESPSRPPSQPPVSQSLLPLRVPQGQLMFPSSSPPSSLLELVESRQRLPSGRQLLFQFRPCPLAARTEDAASSVVGHCGGGGGSGRIRARRSSVRQPPKQDNIPPPYPWATEKRATVHSLEYLEAHGIDKISGQVFCKRCQQVYTMEVDLKKVYEVCSFIFDNSHLLHNRAPKEWLTPRMLDCDKCKQEACVKPVTDEKKKKINWLFLLATQSLGLCTLQQLKYFCKHANSHRTGAKDRVLHDTYISMFSQLNPSMGFPSRRPRMPSSRS